jgi:hypothetical protein
MLVPNYLFLDVDGVLNTRALIKQQGMYALGEEQLRLLSQIVAGTKCAVVLSSAWRHYEDHCQILQETLRHYNIPSWIDKTPCVSGPRAASIREWLLENAKTPCRVVVIDDDHEARLGPLAPDNVEAYFVRTDEEYGLTTEVAELVVACFTSVEGIQDENAANVSRGDGR